MRKPKKNQVKQKTWPHDLQLTQAAEGNCKKPTLMSTGNKNKTSVSNYICIVFANGIFDKLTVYFFFFCQKANISAATYYLVTVFLAK